MHSRPRSEESRRVFAFIEEQSGATGNNSLYSKRFRGCVSPVCGLNVGCVQSDRHVSFFNASGATAFRPVFVKSVLSIPLLLTTFQRTKGMRQEAKQFGGKTRVPDTQLRALKRAVIWKSGSLRWSSRKVGLEKTSSAFFHTTGILFTTTTTSAAFLIHTTTVFTPALRSCT